jgi:uncharacterized protein (TIRG00374 family)
MKKNGFNILIIIISTIALLLYIVIFEKPHNLINAIKTANIGWLICAGICIIIYWFLESITLHILSNKFAGSYSFKDAFQTTMVGQLFNCLTPFSSGGQPVQAYYMVRHGIPIGKCSSILLIKFILFQSVLTVYSLLLLLFRFKFFILEVSRFTYLTIIGFTINLIVVLLLIGIGFFPNIVKALLFAITNILYKLKLIKNKEQVQSTIDTEILQFYDCFQLLNHNISTMFTTSAFAAIQLTAFFSISYFICLALHASNLNYITIISSAAFVLMISSFVPLPGASGGAEGSFYLFFGIFFNTAGSIAIAILIWRIITFYIPILAGIFFSNRTPSKAY